MVPTPHEPEATSHDVVVIGGGPGGYAAALYGAGAGLDVALVEKDRLGGTCLHRGCIPAKELLETAAVFRAVGHAGEFGIGAGTPTVDFGVTQARKQGIIDQLTSGLSGLLEGRKVTVHEGIGSLGAARTVTVAGTDGTTTRLVGDAVIVATGSVPRTIPGFDVDGDIVLTSDEVLSVPQLPTRAVVVGGGAIGCEFASMMADLGTDVTVLEALPAILPGVDPDVAQVVARSFKKRGIAVHTGVRVEGHEPGPDGTTVKYEGGEVTVDQVVVSVGRRPVTDAVGDASGVQIDERGFVVVDDLCKTTADGVYAIGDVIATPGLAHVGFVEGMLVIKDILGEQAVPIAYDRVPWCVYCHPEVAFVGHTEQSAEEAGHEVVVSKHRLAGNGRSMIVGDTDGMVKVIAEKGSDGRAGQVLGVHLAGPWVTEQLGQGYLAVNWEATVDEVAAFIQPHPTISEVFGETMLALTGRALHG